MSNYKNKILIVACTRAATEEEFKSRPLYSSLKYHYDSGIDFHLFKDNKRGLSECYNTIIKDPAHLDKIVLFVHDDLELEDIFLGKKLLESPYSITGLPALRASINSPKSLPGTFLLLERITLVKLLITIKEMYGLLYLAQQSLEL